MRDPLLNEALRRLAAEAATRFSTLVASGDQVPFDVAESEGPDDALFHSYVPLTGRYVREREGELRTLPAFQPAREAIDATGVAAHYLEQRGETVPAEPGERAARLLTVFLADLWDGCTEFSLDRERLDRAVAVLDAEAGDVDEADFVIVPLAGLQMPIARLQLPGGAQLVRADAFEAPIEAIRSEGMGRSAWEPQFFAIAEQGDGADSAAAALQQLSELVSVMRLFKAGGVGLGPYAFAPTGEGSWRRIATGAPAPRPDGYRLDENEAAELAAFAEALEARPNPAGPLAWAVRRFELACERPTALEGLSDHMLALRAVLEGQGPVGASLPMRAAALAFTGSGDRLRIRERIEAAQQLERSLMAGTAAGGATELAAWVEGSVRRILREAALGELGADLNAAADESLIASGLGAGDIEIAVAHEAETEAETAETEFPEPRPEREIAEHENPAPHIRERDVGERQIPQFEVPEFEFGRASRAQPQDDHVKPPIEEDDMNPDTRILEPVPAEDEIRITATDWLDEVNDDARLEESTLDFPAVQGDVEHRERIDTPRVRHLFPVPEDADWEVRDLNYDHYDRRHAG